MIDNTLINDILNPSTKGTDFLCQYSPLVCAVELHRSSGRRRNRAFLLEAVMHYNVGQAHPRFGKKLSRAARLKISIDNLGHKNGQWKGDDVKYGSLHDYIKYHIPKPKICSNCKREGYIEICNISGKYKRDFNDWEWLCRKCHMVKDGRILNLKQFSLKK